MAEDMKPKPSVSRMVHYKPESGRCFAAIVTQVNPWDFMPPAEGSSGLVSDGEDAVRYATSEVDSSVQVNYRVNGAADV
jgi:hypothetical protein